MKFAVLFVILLSLPWLRLRRLRGYGTLCKISFVCADCGRAFAHKQSLNRHSRTDHLKTPAANKSHSTPKLSALDIGTSFVCAECGRAFKHKQSLNRHCSIDHSKTSTDSTETHSTPKFKCSVCANESSFENKSELFLHLKNHHDINVQSENREFETFQSFKEWKYEYEVTNASKFNLMFGSEKDSIDVPKTVYYICHRSGYYNPVGKGDRHLKTQGSKKINGYCPAQIKAKVHQDGKCTIEFVTTHVGHKQDLAHVVLTPYERSSIATKIAAKVPFDAILDEVRDSLATPDDLSRIHLLTRKDLHNIETSFNLTSESVRHKNDPISVESLVNQMRDGDNCVLFYKPQDTTVDEYPFLSKSDFMLAIMNDAQVSILEKYGSDAICTDGTHGLNSYDFELITLIVIDDMRQGFPCAFFFTNRTDKDALILFFTKVKERLGTKVSPNIFMSDMADAFYNAWIAVMNVPQKRLFCTWHVDRAWRKNLNKIDLPEKKVEVYKMIRSLLVERDVDSFSLAVEAAVERLTTDPATAEFGIYFYDHYAKDPESWAYCHRLHAGLNTNMHMESLHKTIKYIYLKAKRIKRLDKAVVALMKLLRDKLFDRIILIHKGKVTSKIQILRKRHKTSLEMNKDIILRDEDADAWKIASSSGTEIYTVTVLRVECDCQLVCTECQACIHRYACSCVDSAIKFNMCKHIHLLCQNLLSTEAEAEADIETADDRQLVIDANSESGINECESLIQQVCKNGMSSKTEFLKCRKEKLLLSLESIKQEVVNSNSIAELDALEKLILPFQPTLAAVRASSSFREPFEEKNPSKKLKIDPQRKFTSTKKKNKKQTEKNVWSKPTTSEQDQILLSLVQMKK